MITSVEMLELIQHLTKLSEETNRRIALECDCGPWRISELIDALLTTLRKADE